MITFPNAKINIGLNITERRADGYHNLETVFYPVQVKDALEIVESDELKFSSSGINIPGSSNTNLCLKAYQQLKVDFDLPPVHIHLHKNIPIGAGLGGGSADAAFCIKLLNQKFSLSLSEHQMISYVKPIGADCAFFILNTPVYAFQKGDCFAPVSVNLDAFTMVLVMPNVHVSTAEAYSGIVPKHSSNLQEIIKLPVTEWRGHISNDFEQHILKAYPLIADVKEALYNAGALYASMSGSGAAVFGIFNTQPDLSHLQSHCRIFNHV